jgi:hypothetical protein
MRVRTGGLVGLLGTLLIGLLLMPNVIAQGKATADKSAKSDKANIQGTLQNISKDTSTFTVRVGSGNTTRLVVYNPKTKFMYGHSDNNKPGALDQVKVGNFISCVGTFDAKTQLMAEQCVYRETK